MLSLPHGTTFYLLRDGSEHGPYSAQQLRVLLANGSVAANCPARGANGETWHAAAEILAEYDAARPVAVLKAVPSAKPATAYAGLRMTIDLTAIFGSLITIASVAFAYIPAPLKSADGLILLGIVALAVIVAACIARGLAHALLDIADNTRR
jgi:hypothetical protein